MKVKGLGRSFGVDLADRLVGVTSRLAANGLLCARFGRSAVCLARMRPLFARGSASSGLADVGTAR